MFVAGHDRALVGVEALVQRQQAGWMLRIRPSHIADEAVREQPHVAGQGDHIDVVPGAAPRRAAASNSSRVMPWWLFAQVLIPSRFASTSPRAAGTFEATSTIS